MHLFTHLVYH